MLEKVKSSGLTNLVCKDHMNILILQEMTYFRTSFEKERNILFSIFKWRIEIRITQL